MPEAPPVTAATFPFSRAMLDALSPRRDRGTAGAIRQTGTEI